MSLADNRTAKTLGASLRLGASLAWQKIRGGDAGGAVIANAAATLGELKGAAQKLGQTLSLVLDDLPPDMQAQLAKLFGQTSARPFAEIQRALDAELGPHRFATFSEVPFAAASLGQVHAATLHDGIRVAVKVQYPGIAEALSGDLARMGQFSALAKLATSSADGFYEEIRASLLDELDYAQELRALRRFGAALQPWPDLQVPRAFDALCTGRILTTALVDAPTLLHFAQTATVADRQRTAQRLFRAVYGPVLREGLLHGDVHPGNFLASSETLTVLDFGCVRTLSPAFADLLRLLRRGATAAQKNDAFRAAGFVFPNDDIARVVAAALYPFSSRLYEPAADTVMKQMNALKRRYPLLMTQMRMPPEATLVMRSLVVGLSSTLKRIGVPFAASIDLA